MFSFKEKRSEACLKLCKTYDEAFLRNSFTAKNHYYRKMAPLNMFTKVPNTPLGFNFSKLTLSHSKSILHSYGNHSCVPIKRVVLISREGGALGKIKLTRDLNKPECAGAWEFQWKKNKRAICKREPILPLNSPRIKTCNAVIFEYQLECCRK